MIDELVQRFGYLAVGLGTMLEGETVLLAAGALAHRGLLALRWVWLSAFLGGVANDLMWFFVGRHAGRPFITRHPSLAKHAGVVDRWIARSGTLFVLGFRFLPGVRTVGPVLLGASEYGLARFMAFNALGAAVWSVGVSLVGFGLGAWLHSMLGRHSRLEEVTCVALVLALVLWLLVKRRETHVPGAARINAEFEREVARESAAPSQRA